MTVGAPRRVDDCSSTPRSRREGVTAAGCVERRLKAIITARRAVRRWQGVSSRWSEAIEARELCGGTTVFAVGDNNIGPTMIQGGSGVFSIFFEFRKFFDDF